MKIAIVHPVWGFDSTQLHSGGRVAVEGARASRFHNEIKLFTGWVEHPASVGQMGADVLPKSVPHIEEKEQPIFAERLAKFNPDIIEIHSTRKAALYLAHALPQIPIIFYCHGAQANQHLIPRLGRSMKFFWLAHTIYVSHFAYHAFVNAYGHADRSSVIHNALPAKNWLADPSQKEKIILFSGRIHAEKGIEELLAALKQILPNHPDWKAVILGLMPLSSKKTSENIKNYDVLQNQCLWITNGSDEKIQTWTKKAMIAVVPSNYDENFPLVLLETHMAGCAVIQSKRGGMGEVSGPDGALYLKTVSGAAIADSLHYLIENPQEREALAQRGHDYVMCHHNINDRARELDDLRVKIVAQAKTQRPTPRAWKRQVRRNQLHALKMKLFK